MKRVLLSSVVVATIALAGCGSSNANSSKDLPSLDSDGSTVTTSRSGSTTSKATTTTRGSQLGELYKDPSGYFQVRVNSAWDETGRDATWYVTGPGTNAPQMSADWVAGSGEGLSESQIRARFENAVREKVPGATGVVFKTIRGGTSNGLYSIEYTAPVSGVTLKFFQVISLANDGVAFAILVALPSDYASALSAAKPYMLTVYALK